MSASATRISVVVADDHQLFRAGVVTLLRRQPDISVVGEAGTGTEVVALCGALQPAVVLLDVEMPGPAAEATIRQLRRIASRTAIAVLTMHNDVVLRGQLLRAGAIHYLTKDASPLQLATCVREAGGRLSRLEETLRFSGSEAPTLLSIREVEILRMVAQAYSNRDIALKLMIAEATVKRHTTNIFAKLRATSRIDAVRKARLLGILV